MVGTQDTTLVAKNNLTIDVANNTTLESHFKQEEKSGIFTSGGFGITIGTQLKSTDQKSKTTTVSGSTVGSIDGNVTLLAGQTYTQIGSQVLAPKGDIDIAAKKVDILEARETSESRNDTKFKQSGLTLAITSPVISAIQTAQQMSQAVSNTSGSSSHSRMQLLGAANTAMAANNAYDAIKAGQGTTLLAGQRTSVIDEASYSVSRDKGIFGCTKKTDTYQNYRETICMTCGNFSRN